MNKSVIRFINENLVFTEEWENIFGREPNLGNVYCPFHNNKDTPAAKIYGNHLHCFSCQRNFSVYDLLNKFDPERIKEVTRSIIISNTTTDMNKRIKPVLNDGILINVLRRVHGEAQSNG